MPLTVSPVPLKKVCGFQYPESGLWTPDSIVWNPESKTVVIGLVLTLMISYSRTTPFKFLNACRLKSLRLCAHMNHIILLSTCSLERTVY